MKVIYLILIMPYALLASIDNYKYNENNQNHFSKINSIRQDASGFLWIASDRGVYKYNGYEFSTLKNCKPQENQYISQIVTTLTNTLIIIQHQIYLYSHENQSCSKLKLPLKLKVAKIYKDPNQKIWLATNLGIYYLSLDLKKLSKLKNINQSINNISSITMDKNDYIIYSSLNKLFILNKNNQTIQPFDLPDKSANIIHDLKISKSNIYIATDINIFNFNLKNNSFVKKPLLKNKVRVPSFIIDNNILWAATIGSGLIKVDLTSNIVTAYTKSRINNNSIKEDTIVSLFLTKNKTLFIGGFYQGLSQLNIKTLLFNYKALACLDKLPNYSAVIDKFSNVWIGSDSKIISYNPSINTCKEIDTSYVSQTSSPANSSLALINNQIWFTNKNELFSINKNTLEIKSIHKYKTYLYKILYNENNDDIYIQSKTKIYIYNLIDKGKQTIDLNSYFSNEITINDLLLLKSRVILSTNQGLYQLNTQRKLIPFSNDIKLFSEEITTTSIDNEVIYIAVKNKGVYKLQNNKLKQLISENQLPKHIIIESIIKTKHMLWISSNEGIIKFDEANKTLHIFEYSDGLYNNYFYKNFSFLTSNNQIYFGGKNGFVSFNPNETFINGISPQIVLEQLYIQDRKVDLHTTQSSGFKINKPINELNEINLSHNDYILGLEFAALDYADPMRNQYAYRLKGFQDEWVYTDAKNRKATYTNLNPGEYVFQVKASNKDGVWSKTHKELKIIVHPAPWFSPWAYALYACIFIFSLWCYIRYKTIASRKRAIFLEQKVEERTQEVNQQKKMVESLLEHKNEVFANITHEFKTPLALILGPAEQLANHRELIQHSNELNMIERNAKRLMLMVGQILKLSQAESDKEVIRESQAVQPLLLMLFEAFKPLAQKNNIDLQLVNTNDVNVYVTTECLEVVVSNLLSNALKYTNEGGRVILKSEQVNNQVFISVKDSGSGIREQDKSKIFKRFTRLETHKSIAGTGIGLSVVKEITEANDGHVTIDSHWGEGSTFTVTFPITDIKASEEMSEVMVDQLVKNTENELDYTQQLPNTKKPKNRVTVLIIDDNLDMQSHIGKVLTHRYNCLFADRGRKGIGLALKELPDIVICDVMMPGMDGYQVTRILRHDGRTSHIPIILLTALNTTESRIKGWRENIDTYMTKPFNADELNAQIGNILTIRKLLQKQTNQAIRNNSALDSLNLSKQDEKFIDKFKDVIGKHYGNEYFQKADLASKMAISERQLQRKLKALINQNPMEMLRDYRLEKAAMKLKDGYQVGIVSDECGFSSVSYFGSCFKKKYGITPKAYQTLNK